MTTATINNILDVKNPMQLNKGLVKILGSDKVSAIVLQQIQYWINLNKKKNKEKNLHKGKWWTFNTVEEWTNHFEMWSYSTVKRALTKLRKLGVLITDNFNQMKYDRTLWYTINYDRLNELTEEYYSKNTSEVACLAISSNCPNAIDQSESMHEVKMNQPIPETNTEIITKTTIKSSSIEEKEEDKKIEIEANNNNNEVEVKETVEVENNKDLNTLGKLCQNLNFRLKKDNMKSLLKVFSIDDITRAITTIVSTNTFAEGKVKNCSAYLLKTLNDFKTTKNVTINNTITNQPKQLNFTNYDQREYDYDTLEKQLLGWDE